MCEHRTKLRCVAISSPLVKLAAGTETYYVVVGNRLYSGAIDDGPVTQTQTTLGGNPFTGDITGLDFDSAGQLYAAEYYGTLRPQSAVRPTEPAGQLGRQHQHV